MFATLLTEGNTLFNPKFIDELLERANERGDQVVIDELEGVYDDRSFLFALGTCYHLAGYTIEAVRKLVRTQWTQSQATRAKLLIKLEIDELVALLEHIEKNWSHPKRKGWIERAHLTRVQLQGLVELFPCSVQDRQKFDKSVEWEVTRIDVRAQKLFNETSFVTLRHGLLHRSRGQMPMMVWWTKNVW